jgi:cell division protein FtsB
MTAFEIYPGERFAGSEPNGKQIGLNADRSPAVAPAWRWDWSWFWKPVRFLALQTVWALVVLWFGYYAVMGQRGIVAAQRIEAEIAQAAATLDTLRAERAEMENRADHLRSVSLDLDLVDEQARRTLGYGHPDDLVIYSE